MKEMDGRLPPNALNIKSVTDGFSDIIFFRSLFYCVIFNDAMDGKGVNKTFH